MPSFLFSLELPELTDSLLAQIPAHRAYIGRLAEEGVILSYSVSAKRDFSWCVVNAESELEALEIVVSFPLYQYYADVVCHPLLFHYTLSPALPSISLN